MHEMFKPCVFDSQELGILLRVFDSPFFRSLSLSSAPLEKKIYVLEQQHFIRGKTRWYVDI